MSKPIQLVAITLKPEDLLFTKSFIKRLGGLRKAKSYLLDIINRYFTEEYIDREITD